LSFSSLSFASRPSLIYSLNYNCFISARCACCHPSTAVPSRDGEIINMHPARLKNVFPGCIDSYHGDTGLLHLDCTATQLETSFVYSGDVVACEHFMKWYNENYGNEDHQKNKP
ncbi:MAG: hypothetical protein KDK34_23550, partial [Leptospiraceae bacterium]|nr:hypothetical protein [Leptospiraceae bacterium]